MPPVKGLGRRCPGSKTPMLGKHRWPIGPALGCPPADSLGLVGPGVGLVVPPPRGATALWCHRPVVPLSRGATVAQGGLLPPAGTPAGTVRHFKHQRGPIASPPTGKLGQFGGFIKDRFAARTILQANRDGVARGSAGRGKCRAIDTDPRPAQGSGSGFGLLQRSTRAKEPW